MKKEVSVLSAVVGMMATTTLADEVVNYQQGKVSDSRYLLASADGMTCGKEMKEKVKECKKMMEEAKCGSKMKECKTLLKEKSKEMSCGSKMKSHKEMSCGGMMKTKEKAKEMACGQCGAMK